eukprot:gene15691-17273_t
MPPNKMDVDEENLRSRIQEQVAFEERAFRHVEKLALANSVTKEDFEIVINEIMPGHYADIIEERSISKLCGYPLCSNKIVKAPKQNFHISMKYNKIYDITERKRFCSNTCFKASKCIESQIPADPLWMRSGKFAQIVFLEDSPKDETSIDNSSDEAPDINISQEDITEKSTEKISTANKKESASLHSDLDHTVTCKVMQSDSMATRSACLIEAQEQRVQQSETIDIGQLCTCFEEWCTIETFKYFNAKERERLMSELTRDKSNDSSQTQDACLNDRSLFMKRFLHDNEEWRSEVSRQRSNSGKLKITKAFVSPPVDSRSQQAIRQRIVSQKLRNGFSEVFSELSLSLADVELDLAALVKTFRFTSQNISLRAKEWKLIASVLLQRMAVEDEFISSLLSKRTIETCEFFNSCNVDEEQLAKLLNVLQRNDHGLEPQNNDVSLTNESQNAVYQSLERSYSSVIRYSSVGSAWIPASTAALYISAFLVMA